MHNYYVIGLYTDICTEMLYNCLTRRSISNGVNVTMILLMQYAILHFVVP